MDPSDANLFLVTWVPLITFIGRRPLSQWCAVQTVPKLEDFKQEGS